MPLIKVTSSYNSNLTKLISSSDFESLKAKGMIKFKSFNLIDIMI